MYNKKSPTQPNPSIKLTDLSAWLISLEPTALCNEQTEWRRVDPRRREPNYTTNQERRSPPKWDGAIGTMLQQRKRSSIVTLQAEWHQHRSAENSSIPVDLQKIMGTTDRSCRGAHMRCRHVSPERTTWPCLFDLKVQFVRGVMPRKGDPKLQVPTDHL